jgi:hypothetical protein
MIRLYRNNIPLLMGNRDGMRVHSRLKNDQEIKDFLRDLGHILALTSNTEFVEYLWIPEAREPTVRFINGCT